MADSIEVIQGIIANYGNAAKWVNAPLGGVKVLSNSHIGRVGQDFVEKWCGLVGIGWEGAPGQQSPWDARLNGVTFEVKTATEDVGGNFQFNHIRHHRPYQALLCIGIAPDAVLFDAWRKGVVSEGGAGHLVTMDQGSSATFKLTKKRTDLRAIEDFQDHLNNVIADIIG